MSNVAEELPIPIEMKIKQVEERMRQILETVSKAYKELRQTM